MSEPFLLVPRDHVANTYYESLNRAVNNGLPPQRAIGAALGVLAEFALLHAGTPAIREMIEILAEHLPDAETCEINRDHEKAHGRCESGY